MINDECNRLRRQLEEVAKAEERQTIVEQLEARRDELTTLRDQVVAVTDSLAAIASRCEIEGKLDPSKCIERVRRARESLKLDPLSLTKGRDFSLLTKAFEKFAEEGRDAALQTWEQYLPRARPTVDMNQVAQAETQEAFKSQASQLRFKARYAEQIGKQPPPNADDLSALERTWEEIRRMIAELPAVSNDPLVQEFLKAANSRTGATLDLLTEEVKQWLTQNKVAHKYCIRTM